MGRGVVEGAEGGGEGGDVGGVGRGFVVYVDAVKDDIGSEGAEGVGCGVGCAAEEEVPECVCQLLGCGVAWDLRVADGSSKTKHHFLAKRLAGGHLRCEAVADAVEETGRACCRLGGTRGPALGSEVDHRVAARAEEGSDEG